MVEISGRQRFVDDLKSEKPLHAHCARGAGALGFATIRVLVVVAVVL